MWILYLITALVVPSIQGASHPASPCPRVFFYEGAEPELDRWYGAVLLSTEESLVGVRLDITLDRPSQLLVSWLGDVTSEDNQGYTVLSLSQRLHPGPPLHSKFMVKFDGRQGIPQVRTIRLNGRQICPPDPNFPIHHDSENGHPSEGPTKRPDPIFPPPVVDLSPTRKVVKPTNEGDYSSHKQTNKYDYNSYEQENAVTQSTASNYNQDVHNSERQNEDKGPKATPRRPVVQNTNSNNNVKNNNNQKINGSSNQLPKPVKKPELSGVHIGVNSGSRVVTTTNTDKGASDVVYQYPINTSNSNKSSTMTTSSNHQSTADDLESANSDAKCGRVQITPIPLITNGRNTARGQWPWHIALYVIERGNLNYICGGSLISNMHVITAAHCVTKEPLGIPLPAEVLVVYLGKYHLKQFSNDGGVQTKQVREIHVLPQFDSSTFTGDIAVLELISRVQFTPYVRPVCLWDPNETEVSLIEGKEGTVVGWGFTENDSLPNQLKMAQMPVVPHDVCVRSFPEFFFHSTSSNTYCAGFRNGTSVCNGDSGGGMVFPMDGTWHLRGVVSIAVSRRDANICDTNHYVVFVDAAKYLKWLQQFVT